MRLNFLLFAFFCPILYTDCFFLSISLLFSFFLFDLKMLNDNDDCM